MEINFAEGFRSIIKNTKYTFTDFTVLTGRNGSGKTNILKAIYHKTGCTINGKFSTPLKIDYFNHNYFDSNSVENQYNYTSSSRDSHLNRLWDIFKTESIEENVRAFKAIAKIANFHNKSIDALDESDFKNYPINREDENLSLFKHNFFEDSISYLRHSESNKFNSFRNQEYGEKNITFTNEEFILRYGIPPWDKINRIFKDIGLNYTFIIPQFKRDLTINGHLIDTISNKSISINDMSNGERTILSIVTSIYNMEITSNIPDIFLFDEPDALLHPEFSKKLIFIFHQYLVKKLGKKVIMTTHSPSTVAIVPEESIFICEKTTFKARPATKDEALNLLTHNINSLSILHENRKQIFVEDKSDSIIFEALKNLVKKYLHNEISLHFIPITETGTQTGGCDKVKNIVKTIRKFGNKSISGIIDWDNKNKSYEGIYVLGENNRYSIENYLLDPILFYGFLLREKIVIPKKNQINFNYQYLDLAHLENKELQLIVDKIVNLALELKPNDSNEMNKAVRYLNEKKVNIPIWFLELRGHDLENHFENKFKELKGLRIKRGETLGKMILNKVIDDYPGYIPVEIVELFRQIQEN